MATSYTGLRVQDTYNAIIKIGDNSNLSGTAKLLSDGLGNDSPLYLSGTRLGIGISPSYQFHTSGNAKIGGNLIISGNLTVNGTLTYLNVQDLAVEDPLIKLAKDNTANTLDIGLFGKYVATGTKYKGFFNDASDDKFKLFIGTGTEPTTTVDTSASGYTIGTLVANLEGNVTGTVSSLSNHDTDDLSEGSTNLYFTTARARASFTAGTGVTITDGEIAIGQDVATDSDVTFGDITGSAISGTTGAFSSTLSANGGINGLTLGNGGITGTNYNIDGVNQLTIADPGEGIVFTGTTTLTLAVIDDTVDDKLKLTNATQLDLNSTAKITNLVDPTTDQDAATKKYVDDHQSVEVAKRIDVTVKNVSGGELAKGVVVHAAPTADPPQGNVIEVIAADANDAAKMPAIGVLNETIADEVEGEAVMFGAVSGIDTSSFSIGDELYVSTTAGEFTATKPTANDELIQKVAIVIKSHASNGLIKVFGAGRANDVPNEVDRDLSIAGDLTIGTNDFTSGTATIGGILLQDSDDRSGLLEINRKGTSSWTGIQIKHGTDLWSVMGNINDFGIYHDVRSQWIMLHNDGGTTEFHHLGSKKLEVTSTGITVFGSVTGNLTGDVTGNITGSAYLNTTAYQGGEGTVLDNSAFNVDGIGTHFRWIESNSGSTGSTWKKVADVVITNAITPNGVQLEAKVYQPNTNSGVTAGLHTIYYSVAFRGRIDDSETHNDAIVYGKDANLLRVYKTADYTFELQARSNDDNRDLVVECNITSKKGGKVTPTTTYVDGTITGGTAYTATANNSNKTKFAGDVEFEGAVFDDAEVEDLRVNEFLYLGSGATSGYGPHIQHSDSGGTGKGMRITVDSDLQVWGVTGNAGEQNQGLYVAGGVAKLYDSNGVVLETVLGGVDITGTLEVSSTITGNVTGNITGDVSGDLTGSVTGAASLNVLKAGDTMTGNLKLNNDILLNLGDDSDLRIYHNTTNNSGNVWNTTGDLRIQNTANNGDIIFLSDDGSGGNAEYFRVDGGDSRVIFGRSIQMADNVSVYFGNDTANDASIKWDSTASQLFIDGESKFLNDLYVVGNQNIGNTSIEADRILKIQTAAEHNTEVQLRESTDNYGFTMRYNGTANQFNIIRHDNSAAGVNVITIGRASNTVAFAGGITTQAISTFGAGITMGGQQINMVNGNIININNLTFNDAGGNEGINWNGGNLWRIFESPNDLSNASGNLQFVKDTTRSMTLDTDGNLFVLGALTSTGHINNGSLTVTSDTGIKIRTTTNGVGAKINFSDQLPNDLQQGTLYFAHADNTSIGSGAAFHFDTTESQISVVSGDATSEGNFLSYSRASTAEVDYGFVADLNTGMYRPANHQLGFVVNGSRKIQLTSTGVFVQNGDLNVSSGNIDVVGNIGAEKVTIATPSVADGGTLGANILSLTGTSETTSTSGVATPTNGIVFKPAMPAGYGTDGYNTVLEQQSGGTRTFYFRTSGASHLSIDVEHDGVFGGSLTASGSSSVLNTGNSGTFVTNDENNYPRITINSGSAQLGLFRSGSNVGGMYIGADGTEFSLRNASFATQMSITQSGNMDLRGTILCDNSVVIDGVDAAGNVTGTDDQLRVTGYGLMGNRAGNVYITNGNSAASASIVFGVNAAHNGNNILVLNKDTATFYNNVTASGHNLLATGGTVKSQHDSTHYAQLESNASGGVVKGIGGGGFLVRSYGDTYFNGGNLGVGIAVPTNDDFGSVAPRLHVLGAGANGEFRLTGRFQAGGDADNTGAAIIINHSNDRGMVLEGGRANSDRGIGHIGLSTSGGVHTRLITIKQHSNADYRFGLNEISPKVDFDFQKYNSTNSSSSTMRIGGKSGNESSKLELAETINGSGVMTYGYALVNDGSANKFAITTHDNSAGGVNSFEISRLTGNVGIKGASGAEALQVNGNIFLTNNSYIAFNTSASSGHPKIVMDSAGTFMFRNTANLTGLQIDNGGNIELNNGVNESVLVKGGTMNFGIPGNGGNVNARFFTIEGNTDASGEGSGRIFFAEHNSTDARKNSYGMSLGYRGGATSLPSGVNGLLSQIGNGEWGMWGHNDNANGTLIMSGTRSGTVLRLRTTHVEMKDVSQRVKFSLWTGTTYGFGMQTGYTFGGLDNNYVISCQMSNTAGRGFWWGDSSHSNAQGAFACTTEGKFTIAHSLRLGYGETDTTTPGTTYTFDVSGSMRATSDVIAFSDRRVKENIVTIDNALEKVTKLRGVNYTRKDIDDKSTKIGVIAQEVLKVLPEVVSIDDEDKHSVAYGNMAGVFIEAIKELKAEVDSLKQEIKQLKK